MISASEEARLRTRLKSLERLAANPGTEAEGENAKRRIAEIEEKLARARERTQVREETFFQSDQFDLKIDLETGDIAFSGPTSIGDIAKGVARMGKRKKKREPQGSTIKDQWPFGWQGPREKVEYSRMSVGEPTLLEWKCPGCNKHICFMITQKQARKISGQRGGMDRYVEMRTGGALNQLCDECWEFWNNK